MSRFFMYGPNGEARIFTDPDEVPKGWRDHPFVKPHDPVTGLYDATLGHPPAIDHDERRREIYERAVGAEELPAFDHDGDGKPGGSISGGSGEGIKALRAEYTRIIGKKPFAGWKEDQLRERIVAAQG